MTELFEDIKTPREFVIYTGDGGMELFNKTSIIEQAKITLDWLLEDVHILKNEFDTISEMLNSSDQENVDLGLNIIEVKSKQIPFTYGT